MPVQLDHLGWWLLYFWVILLAIIVATLVREMWRERRRSQARRLAKLLHPMSRAEREAFERAYLESRDEPPPGPPEYWL